VTEPQLVKLSEVAHTIGVPTDILKLMTTDDLLTGAVRGRGGHIYFREGEIPSWSDCIELLREQRDRHLRRAAAALRRLETELEAVRNDINEAREHPRDALGIDMMSFGHWPHDRFSSSLRGQPLITAVLEQFTIERMSIIRYHDAYLDALASESKLPAGADDL
jgi:hypothetical protein